MGHTTKGSFIKENGSIFVLAILFIVVGGMLFIESSKSALPAREDGVVEKSNAVLLAQCLKDGGATFYGAFWCPHCQKQKALFGDAEKELPYVECSTPDGNAQTQACIDKQIQSYPTWIFKDGTQLTGEVSLAILEEKGGCSVSPPARP